MSEIKLKPCPFCGMRPEMCKVYDKHIVQCVNPECPAVAYTQPFGTEKGAAEAWNNLKGSVKVVAKVEVGEEKLRAAVYEAAKRAVAPYIDLLERNAGAMKIETVCAADMLPVRAHVHDAGADLRASEGAFIGSGRFAKVSTGVRVSIPEGCVGLLAARSGLCARGLLMANGVGIIDAGFTGEIKVPLYNAGNTPSNVLAGERIAQLVILPCELPTFRRVDKLEETERGEGGFGSTGVE